MVGRMPVKRHRPNQSQPTVASTGIGSSRVFGVNSSFDDRQSHNRFTINHQSPINVIDSSSSVIISAASPTVHTESLSAGLSIANHPIWPDLPQGQGELFYECTLFLYSVLALFLQYLNLYKTLWWLPNSHWHHSIKYHLIDPHLLSCVGLLLGLRVTKCFWTTVSELISPPHGPQMSSIWRCVEWMLIKFPMTTVFMSSFIFSFIRVVHNFPIKSLLYFVYPMLVFILLFYSELLYKLGITVTSSSSSMHNHQRPPTLVDIDSVAHMCSTSSLHIREEVDVLRLDLLLRLKHCLFAAFVTAYLAIFIPCIFTPPSLMIDTPWMIQLTMIVALTSFGLYSTYLFPINYCDLLHRSAWHLGRWHRIDPRSMATNAICPNWTPNDALYPIGTVVKHNNVFYKAYANGSGSVAAEPGNGEHVWFSRLAADPLTLINSMCLFEALLIVLQFWMLVLTTDWQHIVTLVLLLFANYLLLAKVFKDKVIIGRIYRPSPEDMLLMRSMKFD